MRDTARDTRRQRELQRLQATIAEQQAQMAQSRPMDSEAEAIQPVEGMPADVVLTLPGFAKKDRARRPKLVGLDRNGQIVRWHYADVVLVMKRFGQPFMYRVAEIEANDEDDSHKPTAD